MSTPYARTHTHIHPPEEIHIHISSPPKEIYWMHLTAGSCMVLLRASWLMGGCRSQGLNPVLGLTRSPPCIGWPWYGMVWCQSRGLNRRSAGIWMSSPSRQFWLSHSHFRTKLPVGWSQCWQLTWDLSAKIKPSSNRMTWDKLFSRHNMRSCGCSDFFGLYPGDKKNAQQWIKILHNNVADFFLYSTDNFRRQVDQLGDQLPQWVFLLKD